MRRVIAEYDPDRMRLVIIFVHGHHGPFAIWYRTLQKQKAGVVSEERATPVLIGTSNPPREYCRRAPDGRRRRSWCGDPEFREVPDGLF
jgi:hypothetical protein